MPAIFYQPITRQAFLKYTASAIGLLATCPAGRILGSEADADSLHLALLSDTHIPTDPQETFRDFAPWANLQQVVPQVLASQPAGVIINGDAARLEGLAGDYQQLARIDVAGGC